MEYNELMDFVNSHPIRNENCSKDQFELSFEWDVADHSNENLVVYYRENKAVGWYNSITRGGHRPY